MSYKSYLRETLKVSILVFFILIVSLLISNVNDNCVYADSYPKTIEETDEYGNPIDDSHVLLTSKYEFFCDNNGETTIWKLNGENEKAEVLTFSKYYLHFVGKANGIYYFNATEDEAFGFKGVYSYKIGDNKLKRIAKNINFWPFKKKYNRADYYAYPIGLMKGRYIPATRFQGTDAAEAYHLYIYDLKTNTKKWIGHPFDLYRNGNKLYWITTSNFDFNSKTKILVKSSSLSGKNIKTIKKYKAAFLKDSYGRGEIGKHYIKWSYYKTTGDSYKNHLFKRKYR